PFGPHEPRMPGAAFPELLDRDLRRAVQQPCGDGEPGQPTSHQDRTLGGAERGGRERRRATSNPGSPAGAVRPLGGPMAAADVGENALADSAAAGIALPRPVVFPQAAHALWHALEPLSVVARRRQPSTYGSYRNWRLTRRVACARDRRAWHAAPVTTSPLL